MSPRVTHGGTDAGPPPRVDASTNANPMGPSPMAVAAVRTADIAPYPDPEYLHVRSVLATHDGVGVDEVVVGAGATELIHRLVAVTGGPVLTERVTFGEYGAAARAVGASVECADGPDTFLEAMSRTTIAFVASPGNPDGRVRSTAWCERVAARARDTGTVVVWDLAYAPFVSQAVPVPDDGVRLYAPNKVHGCTGLRAGWLTAPVPLARRLRDAAVSWLVSVPGVAFLAATTTPQATAWVEDCRDRLVTWRDDLAHDLATCGLAPEVGDAPFVVVPVPGATAAAHTLRRDHAIKVRDTMSLGRPGAWRIAAQPPRQRRLVVAAIRRVLDEQVRSCRP